MTVLNHEWWDPDTFVTRRAHRRRADQPNSPAACWTTASRSGINRAVVEHDVTLIVGPVFPHEVVGFSGGNKYLFPGVSGQELIDVSHWLGALITSAEIIGTRGITPVRALIDEAAVAGARRAARALPGRAVRAPAPCTRPPSGPAIGLGGRRRGRRRDPRPLPGRAGPAGAVADPAQVRGHVDRRQGLLQGRADRRRRRPGGHLRAAHPRGQRDAPAHRGDRLPLPRLLRGASGTASRTTPGATSPTPRTCAVPAPTTPSRASACASPSPWPPASPKTRCGPSTWTTSTRRGRPRRLGGRPRHAGRAAGR